MLVIFVLVIFGVKVWGPRKHLCFWGNKYGVPENACIFGEKKMAAQNVNFVACGQVGFPHGLLLVANEAVPL